MSKSSKLKSLETKLAKAKTDLSTHDKNSSALRDEVTKITQEIEKLKENDPVVSEHALLRYMERVHRVSLDFYRQKLVEEISKSAGLIKEFQSGKFPVTAEVMAGVYPGDYKEQISYHIVVKDGIVRTVETPT